MATVKTWHKAPHRVKAQPCTLYSTGLFFPAVGAAPNAISIQLKQISGQCIEITLAPNEVERLAKDITEFQQRRLSGLTPGGVCR